MHDDDMTLTCRSCGKDFSFTVAEQEFYQLKGFKLPNHCKECRQVKERVEQIVCIVCGRELEKMEGFFCSICHELICEQTTEEAKKVVEELRAELIAAESNSAESLETINEKDQEISELTRKVKSLHNKVNTLSHKVKDLSQELEEAHQLDAKLHSFQSFFNNMEEKLEDIRSAQNLIGKRMVDLVSIMREVFDRTSLWEIIRYKLNAFFKQDIKSETR